MNSPLPDPGLPPYARGPAPAPIAAPLAAPVIDTDQLARAARRQAGLVARSAGIGAAAALVLILVLIYASFGSARRAELSKRGTAQLALKHPEVDMKAVQREMAELTSLTELRKRLRRRLRGEASQAPPAGKRDRPASVGTAAS